MRRREFIALIGGAPVVWPLAVLAQVHVRRPLIAILILGSPIGASPYWHDFRAALQELGYVEERNIDVVYRYADGDVSRIPALATELVTLGPDVIVTVSNSSVEAVSRTNASIPIVS
jgi:ABC-type uncharacterized transport system substrate-binding protein